jgi:hypothetical protein
MGFVGFRIGKKDRDIEQNLARFTDQSKRMREVYRLAMAVERGEYVRASEVSRVAPPYQATQVKEPEAPKKDIDWKNSFPKEPSVKPKEGKAALKNNMLQGF